MSHSGEREARFAADASSMARPPLGDGTSVSHTGVSGSRDPSVAALSAGVATAALSVSVIMALSATADMLIGKPDQKLPAAASSVCVAVLMVVLGLRHRRRPLSDAVIPHAVGMIASACALSVLWHVAVTSSPLQMAYVVIVFVASGAILSDLRWLLAIEAVGGMFTVVIALTRFSGEGRTHVLLALLFSIGTAHVLFALTGRGRRQLRALHHELTVQALHDDLTGLLNRRGLGVAIGQRLAGAGPAQVAVVCLDVDGFKRINDQEGHAAGDQVLVDVSAGLRAVLRDLAPGALTGRTGGDEFVAVLPELSSRELPRLVEAVQDGLRGEVGTPLLAWTVSVGAAAGPVRGEDDVLDLIRAADADMYADKQRRRARRRTDSGSTGPSPVVAAEPADRWVRATPAA